MTTPVTEKQILAALLDGTASQSPYLADAVALYRAAGRAALREQVAEPWLQVRVRFANWATAEATAAKHLAPRLEALRAVRVLGSWWYLRKHPEWRLRCLPGPESGPDVAMGHLGALLDDLAEAGHLEGWRRSHYEPEILAFGGPEAIAVAHALFAADSREVLRYDHAGHTLPGRRELSVVLCTAMLRAALLDPIERADVWQRVADSRSREADQVPAEHVASSTPALHRLIHLDTGISSPVFTPGQTLHFASAWTDAFRNAGAKFTQADRDGNLQRGLREVLATAVRHHWNRLGLTDDAQALLALSIRTAEMTPYCLSGASSR